MRKVLKFTFIIIGSIFLILLGALIYLNTPSGQNFVRGRAVAYLRDKLKTEVRIGHLGYGFPKYIVINDALLLDQAKDTLLIVSTLKVDLNMMQLFHKKFDIQQIVVKDMRSHIYRNTPDTNYNFTYIITAFTGNTAKSKQPSATNATDTSSSLSFHIDNVKLDNIHFRFDDYTGGIRFGSDLDHLDLKMKKLDLDNMFFHVKDLTVSGLHTVFDQDTSYIVTIQKDTTKSRVKIIADNVDMKHVLFRYNNNLNKFLFALQLGSLQLQLNEYNRDNNRVDIKKLAINNSDAKLDFGKSTTAPSPVDTIIRIDTTEGWDVRAKDIDIAGINIKIDNENEPRQLSGIDYSHLNLRNLALNVHNLLYSDTASGELRHFAVTDTSGLDIKEFKTVFNYTRKGAILKDLYVQTPNTVIQNYIEFHYPSLVALKKQIQSLQLKVNIENSFIGLHDAALFMPYLQKQELFQRYKNSRIRLDAELTGFLNDLKIAKFYAQGLENTEISFNGRLSGLPEPKSLRYNLHIAKFNSSEKDITALLPSGTLPSSVRIPDRFGVTGQIAGNQKDYNANLILASTDGIAYLKGLVATSPGPGRERYDFTIKTIQLNVGRIIRKDSLLGAISSNMDIKGQGFDFKTMTASADGNISAAFIKGYRYHDIIMSGKVAAQRADADMSSADSNLRVQLNAHADFSGKYAAVLADIRIDSADFRALKLSNTELRARGKIHADFPELNPDYPDGSFTWKQFVIVTQGKRYFMDSIYAISRPNADTGQNIFINLGAMDARITGKTPLTKIGAIVQDHINRHYSEATNDSLKINLAKIISKKSDNKSGYNSKIVIPVKQQAKKDTVSIPADYNLSFMAHVYDKPMIHGLLPGLTSFDSIHIDGSLTPRFLILDINAPEIVYGSNIVENGKLQLRGSDSELTYKLTVDQLSRSGYALYFADVQGSLSNSIITTSVSLCDAGRQERFALKANMQTIGDSQVIRLQPGLKLNYSAWQVTEPNRIVLNRKGFYVQNFGISNNEQFIRVNNEQPQSGTPLKIDFNNFTLANITDIASRNDTLLANGILNGNVTIEQMTPLVKMSGNLQIQNLSVYSDTVGNLDMLVDNKTEGLLNAKVTLKGYGNDISLTGVYNLNASSNYLNFNLDINALAVRTFEGLTFNQIRSSSGYLRGNLKVQGTFSSPDITGELHTDNLKTTVTALNTDFKMPEEKIAFTTNQITFNNFTILDSAGNKAYATGSIGIADITDPDLNLTFKADNWRAIHGTYKENKQLYGSLILSANLSVSGTATTPSVDGYLHVLKGTNMTVSNPSNNPEFQSSKGIVVFVNMRDSSRGTALMPRVTDTIKHKHKFAVGSEINVNITVDKNAEFSLIIDEASGDFVKVRGDAYLNTSVSPDGTLSVAGSYLLHSRMYQMNYNFIRRRFLIQDGSTVVFAGDPLKNTTLDVSAVYAANTPAYDLVMRQVSDPVQLNYFKQNLPFEVNLHMKGNMLLPAFTFDVVLPENKVYPLSADQIELVQAKLNQLRQDTSELNKQVFAVLILGRFVSDDPFSSGAAQGLGFAAIQSVSAFIGEELNRAANNLIKGVDLSVDLATTQDYTTGDMRQRTDLNVAASKRILNDRLKLTVGNDFEVEGPQTNGNQSGLLPSNLAADYMLSGDGRYVVRVYRRNYDEGALQGFVTETGLNFIVSYDYTHFKEIFMKKPKIHRLSANNNDTLKMANGL